VDHELNGFATGNSTPQRKKSCFKLLKIQRNDTLQLFNPRCLYASRHTLA